LDNNGFSVSEKSWVGLYRKSAILATVLIEDRIEQACGFSRNFANKLPPDFLFVGARPLFDQLPLVTILMR
jgi:hypothetical protein